MQICICAVFKNRAPGNGHFAKRNFPFCETFAVSFAGHACTYFMISRIMLTTLCFQDMGYGLCWKHFLSYYHGTIADLPRFLAGFLENGYLDHMCYIKLSRNRNFPFANIIAELSRTPTYTCNVRFYINPLQGPIGRSKGKI